MQSLTYFICYAAFDQNYFKFVVGIIFSDIENNRCAHSGLWQYYQYFRCRFYGITIKSFNEIYCCEYNIKLISKLTTVLQLCRGHRHLCGVKYWTVEWSWSQQFYCHFQLMYLRAKKHSYCFRSKSTDVLKDILIYLFIKDKLFIFLGVVCIKIATCIKLYNQ